MGASIKKEFFNKIRLSTSAHDTAARPVEAAIGTERSILLAETQSADEAAIRCNCANKSSEELTE